MDVKLIRRGEALVVEMQGELDLQTTPGLRRQLDRAIRESSPELLIFDLKALSFMDSSGIGVILGRYQKMEQQGKSCALIAPQATVKHVLSIAGVLRLIPTYQTQDEALSAVMEESRDDGR